MKIRDHTLNLGFKAFTLADCTIFLGRLFTGDTTLCLNELCLNVI